MGKVCPFVWKIDVVGGSKMEVVEAARIAFARLSAAADFGPSSQAGHVQKQSIDSISEAWALCYQMWRHLSAWVGSMVELRTAHAWLQGLIVPRLAAVHRYLTYREHWVSVEGHRGRVRYQMWGEQHLKTVYQEVDKTVVLWD